MGAMPGDASWLHTLDPWAFHISGALGVRWYGLAYIGGFIAAWLILGALAKRGLIRVPREAVGDLILAVIIGTIVGGRLGYILVYQPSLLWQFSSSPPWWGALALNHGGMASHGGMIGIAIACVLFARRHGISKAHVVDCLALVAPVGIVLGRIANFVNGELLGRIAARPGEPGPWWAVRFPQELLEPGHAPALSPEQEQGLDLLAISVAPGAERRYDAFAALIDRVQSGDQALAESLAPYLSARHPSQLYQALAEGVIVGLVVWAVWARPRKPGVITAWFLITYAVGRIATEFIRLPDAHLQVQRILGLSRGQWLSVAMIVVGLIVLRFASRSNAEPVGGWLTRVKNSGGEPSEARPS